MSCFSLTENLTGNRHPAACAHGCLFCALKRTHPLSSWCSRVSETDPCLDRLSRPPPSPSNFSFTAYLLEGICLPLGLQPVRSSPEQDNTITPSF